MCAGTSVMSQILSAGKPDDVLVISPALALSEQPHVCSPNSINRVSCPRENEYPMTPSRSSGLT